MPRLAPTLFPLVITLTLASGILAGCSSDSGDTDTPPGPISGEALYREPLAQGNSYACASCHALEEPAADGIRRPGHAIGDALRRASFKNGQLTDPLDAVNTCLVEWMLAPAWTPDDPEWLALGEFLDSVAPETDAPAISFTIVNPPDSLTGGDSDAGQTLFNSSCVVCHGQDAAGTERAPPLVGELLDAETIARRIRTSGLANSPTYDGLTGGRMPFWSADRLADDELLDLVAFVLQNNPIIEVPDPPDDSAPGQTNCASTHPRIGQTAEFRTLAHRVAGTARIIDDCTIQLENFTYDGNGIDVRVYGGLDGDYDNGFAITGDLRRSGGYSNETVTATLPEGMTLDDLNGLSVWCVDVGVNFGDADFPQL